MAKYVILFDWTEQGIRNYRDSPGRVDAARGELGKLGIAIEHIYWTLGPHDVVGVIDAPDDETLTKALLALGAQGNVRTTTMRAFDQEEFSGLL
ncbi:MAG TPA: GYD domain-containing protein [Gaiellaceae bacterium]|nr:GYD domain-containing protein [Gaiellaceae bacterium]